MTNLNTVIVHTVTANWKKIKVKGTSKIALIAAVLCIGMIFGNVQIADTKLIPMRMTMTEL